MNLSKMEAGNDSTDGNSNSNQLLHDIEAISKALYFPKTPPKTLISPYDNRSKSAEKTRFTETQKRGILDENVLHKNKKSSSLWNWKKPLKALAHIGHHRFDISFFLHVHSIEGLPTSFNDTNLRVHWKRKDEVFRTRPSTVLHGVAVFEEILMHSCCVYGSRGGERNSAKYEAKLSLICASIVGAPAVDLGKHWVDLTRLLPITLEELEEENSSGKWTTSFKLAGKAKGATLHVSFGFTVKKDNMNVSELINLTHNRSTTQESGIGFGPSNDNMKLKRVGSVPSKLNHRSALLPTSVDDQMYEEVSPNLGMELSKSINFLYEKLNEGDLHSSEEFDFFSQHEELRKPKPNLDFDSAKDIIENECDFAEFTVIEKGIEMSETEQLTFKQSSVQTADCSVIETIDVGEIITDDDMSFRAQIKCNSKENTYIDEVVVNDCKNEESGVCTTRSTTEDLESAFNGLLISELDWKMDEFLEKESYMEAESNYRATEMLKKSHSLDDVTETVESDFLNMLGIGHGPFDSSSDADPESPRERLLREFEKEALASGDLILGFDAREDQVEFSCVAPTGSGFQGPYKDFDFFPVIQGVDEEQKRSCQLLKTRRQAINLEDLETESLMREWGLNERSFQSSPNYRSCGFGSPIELPREHPFEVPPLGEGFGPIVQTIGGGHVRSMNPSLFRNAKNVDTLIMQVSGPVVLPAEMGSEIIDILQQLASVGIKKLHMKANKLMPLEDITGKTLQQSAEEAAPKTDVPDRNSWLQKESLSGQDFFSRREQDEELRFDWISDNMSSGLIGSEMGSGRVSLEEFSSLAMDRIETLSIEGLRIQSGMSDEEAPSCIRTHSDEIKSTSEWKSANFIGFLSSEGAAGSQLLDVQDGANDLDGLMDLSITLDEWLKLDRGIISDEDQISERTAKILAAHHAQYIDLANGTMTKHLDWSKDSGKTHGLLGNNLTVAFMVLLRDPLRNYEPVGNSMLALFEVERASAPLDPTIHSTMIDRDEEADNETKVKKEGTPWFKIAEVHLAGVNTEHDKNQLWGTKTQQQSGMRWLLASGMNKSTKQPFSNSKAIVRSFPRRTRKMSNEDVLWSITSNVVDTETNWKEFAELVPHLRNPDIIFPNESTGSLVA